MRPSIGRTVLYTLSEQDAAAITAKRGPPLLGSGNPVSASQKELKNPTRHGTWDWPIRE